MRKIIQTNQAPAAIGVYSQAVQVGETIYISGQIPLDPKTMQMVEGDFRAQAVQAFENLKEIVLAAECELSDIVKINIFLRDMAQFSVVNEVMATYFQAPYPARAVIEVSGLPKEAVIEMDAVLEARGTANSCFWGRVFAKFF